MNKKGFTLIELIVSIVLVSVVMVSMLMALVKLRENYSTVNENANALVYSNAASRIINNDILQNDGIKNVSCSANHLNCDVVLGNGSKRQLQIVELAEGFSNQSSEEKIDKCKKYCNNNSKTNENCNCNGKKAIGIIETKKTSLVYYDTTKEKKLKYIKTFELETKTQIDSNNNLGTSTISGYSFLSLDTKYNTYKSNIDGYENKLATVVVRTYNGYDAEDRTYDIKMYSNSTYSKDSQLAGTVFKLKIIDDGDIKKASPDSFYLKYDVGYYKDLDGDEIDSLDNVSSKTGYTLIRYDDSNGHEVIDKSGNFLSKIAFDNTNTSKKEGEIRPVWSANTYVVSFNPGKGTLDGNSNKDVVYDGTYGDLPTASRAGYSFDGWYTSETGGSKVSSNTPVKITNNQTLYARYTPKKIDYLVRYDQENAQDANYTTKETITLNADMDSDVTVTPKTYTGFKTPAKQKITIKESGNSVTFQYKRNVAKIKLNANGGVLNASEGFSAKISLDDDGTVLKNGNIYYQKLKHEQVLGTSGLANPDNKSYINLKKTGYRIPNKSEWCTKADGTGTCYQDDNSAENDPTYTSATFCNTNSGNCEITLYVHWVARTYTVTFVKNDGSGDNAGTRTVTYDTKYGSLPTVSRTGYTFVGWFTAASGGTQITTNTTVKITAAQTLYAHWKASSLADVIKDNSTLVDGCSLKRFQGTTANNYICFGTSNKSACLSNTDKYLYRIIGVTSDNSIKLIKYSPVGPYKWHNSNAYSPWISSALLQTLNSSSFLSNTTYVPSGWEDKIVTFKGTFRTGANVNFGTDELNEVNQTICKYESNGTMTYKVGLMNVTDYYYATSNNAKCTLSTANKAKCATSWIDPTQNGSDSWPQPIKTGSNNAEWIMGYRGWLQSSGGYYGLGIMHNDCTYTTNTCGVTSSYGRVDNARYVRPVFFLSSGLLTNGGSGTRNDPFLIS